MLPTEIVRPDSTVANREYTPEVSPHLQVNEGWPPNDSTYIQGRASVPNSYIHFGLDNPTFLGSSVEFRVRVRGRVPNSAFSGGVEFLLYDGLVEILDLGGVSFNNDYFTDYYTNWAALSKTAAELTNIRLWILDSSGGIGHNQTDLFISAIEVEIKYNPPGYTTTTTTTAPPTDQLTWDPLWIHPTGMVLENSNLTARCTVSNDRAVGATLGKSSGKWYWEIEVVGVGNYRFVGIAQSGYPTDEYVGRQSTGYGYYSTDGRIFNNMVGTAYGNLYGNGDIIGVALDMDNARVFFAKNGVWQNGGDPVTGTNPAASGIAATTWYPADSLNGNLQEHTIVGYLSRMTYTPPAGFSAMASEDVTTTTTTFTTTTTTTSTTTTTGTGSTTTTSPDFFPSTTTAPPFVGECCDGTRCFYRGMPYESRHDRSRICYYIWDQDEYYVTFYESPSYDLAYASTSNEGLTWSPIRYTDKFPNCLDDFNRYFYDLDFGLNRSGRIFVGWPGLFWEDWIPWTNNYPGVYSLQYIQHQRGGFGGFTGIAKNTGGPTTVWEAWNNLGSYELSGGSWYHMADPWVQQLNWDSGVGQFDTFARMYKSNYGNIILITITSGPDPGIYYSRQSLGSFSTPTKIPGTSLESVGHRVTLDDIFGMHIFWEDSSFNIIHTYLAGSGGWLLTPTVVGPNLYPGTGFAGFYCQKDTQHDVSQFGVLQIRWDGPVGDGYFTNQQPSGPQQPFLWYHKSSCTPVGGCTPAIDVAYTNSNAVQYNYRCITPCPMYYQPLLGLGNEVETELVSFSPLREEGDFVTTTTTSTVTTTLPPLPTTTTTTVPGEFVVDFDYFSFWSPSSTTTTTTTTTASTTLPPLPTTTTTIPPYVQFVVEFDDFEGTPLTTTTTTTTTTSTTPVPSTTTTATTTTTTVTTTVTTTTEQPRNLEYNKDVIGTIEEADAEFEALVNIRPESREERKAKLEIFKENWSRVFNSPPYQVDPDAAEAILNAINPALKADIDSWFDAGEDATLIEYLFTDLHQWILEHFGAYPNIGGATAGIPFLIKQVIDFFKPYRARLAFFESALVFDDALFDSVILDDSSSMIIYQTVVDTPAADSTSCCAYPYITCDSTAGLYYSRRTYDCGSYYDTGIADDLDDMRLTVRQDVHDFYMCLPDGSAVVDFDFDSTTTITLSTTLPPDICQWTGQEEQWVEEEGQWIDDESECVPIEVLLSQWINSSPAWETQWVDEPLQWVDEEYTVLTSPPVPDPTPPEDPFYLYGYMAGGWQDFDEEGLFDCMGGKDVCQIYIQDSTAIITTTTTVTTTTTATTTLPPAPTTTTTTTTTTATTTTTTIDFMTITAAYDGRVYGTDVDWPTTRDKAVADSADSPGLANSSCALVHNAAFQCARGFFTFDTTALINVTVLSAKLRVHGWKTFSPIALCAQEATLSNPLDVTVNDYQAFTGPLLIDSFSPWDNLGWNEMDLNVAGVAYLQSIIDIIGQYAMFCTREYDHDYLNVGPTSLLIAYCNYSASGLVPELVIEYSF